MFRFPAYYHRLNLSSVKQLQKTLISQCSYSTQPTKQSSPVSDDILKNVISSHISYKYAFLSFLETIHQLQNIQQNEFPRKVRQMQDVHLKQLEQLLSLYRVAPPISPVSNAVFSSFGAATVFMNISDRNALISQLSRLVENHTDFCLFQMNEHAVEASDVRKLIIQMRDEGYACSQEQMNPDQPENQCLGNFADYVFAPILRQHFGQVE